MVGKNYDKMVLGSGIEYTTNCDITGVNNNVLVAGGSGSGKTYSIVLKRLIEVQNSNLIVTTTKNRVYDLTHRMLENRNYQVLKLDFSYPELSNCYWNPLDVGSWQDITQLATDIVYANCKRMESTSVDPYWNETSISLLSSIIGYVKCTKGNKANMTDVMSMFHSLKITNNSSEYVETNLDEKFQNFEEKCGSDHFVVQMWKTVSVLPVKTIKCVIGSLATTLDKVFTDDVLKNLSPEKEKKCFSISEFATQKSIIFINISPCNVNLHYLLNILYANIFNKLIELAENRGGVLNIPIQIVADDFACAGAVNNFQQYISIFRQAGISTLLLIQSEAQLENIYGDSAARIIIDNCDTYVYMGCNDRISARNISEKIDRPLNEVLNMKIGKEIIMRRGKKPQIFVDRYEILKDKEYKKLLKEYENEMTGR